MGPYEHATTNIQELDESSREESIGHDPQDLAFLNTPGDVDLDNPRKSRRLGWISVILIIANRMIGMCMWCTFSFSTSLGSHTQANRDGHLYNHHEGDSAYT